MLDQIETFETTESDLIHSRIRQRRPFKMTGFAASWPSVQRWTMEYFKAEYGTLPITIEEQPDRDPNIHWKKRAFSETTLGAFADRILAGEQGIYLSEWKVLTRMAGAMDDVPSMVPYQRHRWPLPKVISERFRFPPTLWFGPEGTYTNLHRDPTDNLLVQVQGEKRLVIYSPDQDAQLYAPWHEWCNLKTGCLAGYSPIHMEAPDLERYPRFAESRGMEVVIRAGDLLYMPAYWWHYVVSLTPAMSLSYWWFYHLHQWRRTTAAWTPRHESIKCLTKCLVKALTPGVSAQAN